MLSVKSSIGGFTSPYVYVIPADTVIFYNATYSAPVENWSTYTDAVGKFIEVFLGKTGSRIDLMGHKSISLIDLNSPDQLKSKIESFKSYLVGLTNNKGLSSMTNTDLLNIRDEILGDMNQFLYLLTFK